MRKRTVPPPFLRRHPRLRRAYHRLRASLAAARPEGPPRSAPLVAAFGLVLAGAIAAVWLAPPASASPHDADPADWKAAPTAAGPSASDAATPPATSPTGEAVDPAVPTGSSLAGATGPAERPTPALSSGAAPGTDCGTGTTGARDVAALRTGPSLSEAADRFSGRLDALRAALSGSAFVHEELVLDAGPGVRAFVLARNAAGAANLNGYFYFLFDPTASDDGISPLVLVLDRLFTEDDRARALADRTFCTPELEALLRDAFAALLGEGEGRSAADFTIDLYRATFAARLDGAAPTETRRYLVLPGTTVVFQDSYLTYVEFLPGGEP